MAAEQSATLVIIPFPVVSHQAATVQLAELLVDRDPRLSIVIIVMKLPTDTRIASRPDKTSPDSRISFIELPRDVSGFEQWTKSPRSFVMNYIFSQRGPVKDSVEKIMEERTRSSRLVGFVVDMFCTPMMDVAHELNVPSYVFFTSSASCLGLFYHLQGLSDYENQDLKEYENSDAAIAVPTYANPVPARVWPLMAFDRDSNFLNFMRKFREAKGVIINTFLEFEPHAVRALMDDENLPSVYPVGPIIKFNDERGTEKHDEITKWLDEKPDSSVVYLCFGSRGSFGTDQVREIAVALENSGCSFLWSLRRPVPKDKLEFPGEYEDPGEALPEGFLERTAGAGKIIGWAPQMSVLSHRAVGGFVSHCGWNSTLESVWCGVPVATWPLSAEQQANAFQLVREYGMAVEVKMDYKWDCGVIVTAETIERAVRDVMSPGNGGRAKVRTLSQASHGVMLEGGSSYDFLGRFISEVLNSVA